MHVPEALAEALSPAWLTEALGTRYPGIEVVAVTPGPVVSRISTNARFRIEWHRKPMLAVACLVFFFIGAPLGAIIRKGGMGLPTVFAIVFFLVFHIISFSMEKLVVAGGIGAWPGMWIGTLVLAPIGAFLTWKAATDSPLFDADAYYRGWQRFRSILRRSHAHPSTVQ